MVNSGWSRNAHLAVIAQIRDTGGRIQPYLFNMRVPQPETETETPTNRHVDRDAAMELQRTRKREEATDTGQQIYKEKNDAETQRPNPKP